jgi:DNA-binding transcriptional MerR regulator/effector-binding domain-containing protein
MSESENVLFSIGEFSRITGLTVKALRFYHDEGLLAPVHIDLQSGYRYYGAHQAETARAVRLLRDLEFPVKEIREILAARGDDEQVTAALERQKAALETKIKEHKKAVRALQEFIDAEERQGAIMANVVSEVQEKDVPAVLVAGIRMKGKYSEVGPLFGKLCRGAGGAAAGPPMTLYYDMEYKESDADFEACVPLKKKKDVAGANVRELCGGKCVSLIHKGSYEELHGSYERIMKYLKEKGYKVVAPPREIYLKGPGMIFRGNPKNYLTEIQFLVEK